MRRLAAVILVAFAFGGGALAQTPPKPASPTMPPASAKPAAPPATNGSTLQFKDEASAKTHCPGDTVVWANLASKVYHLAGTRYYGKTRKGAYICKQDADNHGFRLVREELVKPAPAPAPATTKP
jgi:hypothetical protein